MATGPGSNQGKTAFLQEFLPANQDANEESVNRAYEAPLSEGLLFERRVFHSLFATRDQKEGMRAFLEKRAPDFGNH